MLTKVEVRNAAGALLSLPVDDISQGYIVQNIDGLDPVKATITSSTFANLPGAQFQNAQRETRNVVLTLGLDPDPTTDDTVRILRSRLYAFFMTGIAVRLRFYMDDGLVVNSDGRVESCEAALFAKEPAMDISIICFDPDFIALAPEVISGGTVSTSTNTLLSYPGTVDAGLELVLTSNRSFSGFTIYHQPPDGSLLSLDFQAALISGDVVTISTVVGEKRAILTRAGVDTSVLYGVSPQANWMQLQNGDNYYRVYTTGAAIPFTITYTEKYGGL